MYKDIDVFSEIMKVLGKDIIPYECLDSVQTDVDMERIMERMINYHNFSTNDNRLYSKITECKSKEQFDTIGDLVTIKEDVRKKIPIFSHILLEKYDEVLNILHFSLFIKIPGNAEATRFPVRYFFETSHTEVKEYEGKSIWEDVVQSIVNYIKTDDTSELFSFEKYMRTGKGY